MIGDSLPTHMLDHETARGRTHGFGHARVGDQSIDPCDNCFGIGRGDREVIAVLGADTGSRAGGEDYGAGHRHCFENLVLDAARDQQRRDHDVGGLEERSHIGHLTPDPRAMVTVLALLGLRAGIVLAFPLAYAFMLVPFGDEIIPPLQMITAEIATAMTRWSGIEMVADGILIDTPAGLFIVAEECSGVKFLIAMVALGILVAHTCFSSWHRRAWFLFACVVVPVIANGIRAWATIFIAQYVGAEAAGGFDHIVYGWFFFALVLALVLGVAWRWFEREPEEAGWSANEIAAMRWVEQWEGRAPAPATIGIATLLAAGFFAVFAQLV